jgi:hypothetical protein
MTQLLPLGTLLIFRLGPGDRSLTSSYTSSTLIGGEAKYSTSFHMNILVGKLLDRAAPPKNRTHAGVNIRATGHEKDIWYSCTGGKAHSFL